MPRFKFRLETLLKMRRATRDQRRGELAKAYQAERILQERVHQLEQEMNVVRNGTRKHVLPGSIDVERLLSAKRHQLILEAERSQVQQQSQQVATEIERRREALVQADRETRILEKLRAKKLDRHRQEEARRENKQLDEVAQRRPLDEEFESACQS